MGLFSGLFTYRPREGRTPLEEFTSAGLIYLLNRLSNAEQIKFLANFSAEDGGPIEWSKFLSENEKFRWNAEFPVKGALSNGRADLIAFDSKKRPRIIIENKIGADVSDTQLAVYRDALARDDDVPVALIFLSHTTSTPEQLWRFSDDAILVTAHSRWRSIGKWLSDKPSHDEMTNCIAAEFRDFLHEQGILQTMMNMNSGAALQLFLAHRDVIENSIYALLEPMQDEFSSWISRKQSLPLGEDGVFGFWTNMPKCAVPSAFFGAAIVYPDQCGWWLPGNPLEPHFVIYLSADKESGWPNIQCDGWHWREEDRELLALTPVAPMLVDEENSEALIREWSRKQCKTVAKCIAALENGGGS